MGITQVLKVLILDKDDWLAPENGPGDGSGGVYHPLFGRVMGSGTADSGDCFYHRTKSNGGGEGRGYGQGSGRGHG